MDLQDFEGQAMYFDEPMPAAVSSLIEEASRRYADGMAEPCLQRAYALAPVNLSVLVAMYRFYYYQHRLREAIGVAEQVMAVVAPGIGFPEHWRSLCFNDLANGLMVSFTRVRFYLLALKGAAYLQLRIGNIATGVEMLNKVVEFDSNDRLGARALLQSMGPALMHDDDEQARQPAPLMSC
ncbi:hypothetical protein [Parathalassolituus penaei]|uniref:Tetratricopeptide repeat protein n=1 Tax=Parathalassolituus penaei TaxID=2997323 RepID=A0A9X3EDL9_9GAMM|nr:hypothetical protein [Parathalassolituus penaei]MCY0965643.1 hypothetical protein [Parathalassolituus penaei]